MTTGDTRPLFGIALKILSVAVFVGMQACIKAAGEVPTGQIAFYRSFFAIFPIVLFLAWQRELPTALHTKRPFGHIMRGVVGIGSMAFGFFALTRLPLPEWITINYAQPLLVVAFSALFLGEHVRAYRWTAVGVGLLGVVIVAWPKLTLFASGEALQQRELVGVIALLIGAAASAVAMLQVRSLVQTERTASIVLWFSLTASVVSLISLPLGWAPLSGSQAAFLIAAGCFGGVAQIFMTEAYRHAEASTVAPFEYTSILLGVAVGYFAFNDVPTPNVLVGGAVVIGAGVFIVWREQRLGIKRREEEEAASLQ